MKTSMNLFASHNSAKGLHPVLVNQDHHERVEEGLSLTLDQTIRRSYLWPSIGYLSVLLKRDKH